MLRAMPVDKNRSPVNGLAVQWKSSNPEVLKIINDSQALAVQAGEATLTVFSGKLQQEFSIKISDNSLSNANSVN